MKSDFALGNRPGRPGSGSRSPRDGRCGTHGLTASKTCKCGSEQTQPNGRFDVLFLPLDMRCPALTSRLSSEGERQNNRPGYHEKWADCGGSDLAVVAQSRAVRVDPPGSDGLPEGSIKYGAALSSLEVSPDVVRLVCSATGLRPRYAMPHTEIVYGAIGLSPRYGFRGSDLSYGAIA
eukprot:3607215-Rhodomonas_salina.1